MAKKYEKYKITVQYINGDKEDINLMGIRTDDYNKMLSVYHNVKDKYSEKVKTIDFCGISKDGSIGIMFRKEIKLNTEKTELSEDILEICNRISRDMLLIKEKYFYHKGMIPVLNKKQDVLLHEIESSVSISDEKKIELLNKLQNLRKERRWHKNQLRMIKDIQKSTYNGKNINMTHLSNVFNIKESSNEYTFNFKIADKKNVYHEEIIKDKEQQESKLKKRFDYVYSDELNNIIYAYNKSKAV